MGRGDSGHAVGLHVAMILRYEQLSLSPQVFKTMAGIRVAEFDDLVSELIPRLEELERVRRAREGRRRAPGGGHPYGLPPQDRILLTLIRLRQQLPHEVLGYFFGVSGATVARTVAQIMPLLEAGKSGYWRTPTGGTGRGYRLELLATTGEASCARGGCEERVAVTRTQLNCSGTIAAGSSEASERYC